MINVDTSPNFAKGKVFTDEATISLNGNVKTEMFNLNGNNCRQWADTPPQCMMEGEPNIPLKVNVWAGIVW